MSTSSAKTVQPLSIRPSSQQKRVIAQAAKLLNVSVSQFILQRAYTDAQAVLAEQTRFGLNDAQWKSFLAALDAPAKQPSGVRKLLQEPGVFDGDR
ncbi:MAG: DUF1778 domain-containing protein [Planctomycetota bacterium]